VKKRREQLDLGLGGDKHKPTGPERTLEVSCMNCGAKFIAYYGSDDDDVETVEVQKCGRCRDDEYKRDNFKDATIRLVALRCRPSSSQGCPTQSAPSHRLSSEYRERIAQ
jgi:hypothetical protein